jgi:nitrite reductase/ring-hydroxylating ferredoxin subunit
MAVQTSKVDELVARARQSLKQDGTLPVEIFADEDVYQVELDRIFGRSWLVVGHESEIAKNGDYMLRYMGEDEVIVNRDESGQIRVMLNSCRHRGTVVCRDEKGNSSHFVCPFHSWTYKNDGTWIAAAKKQETYKSLDGCKWGLLQARVEVRWGLIFACMDPHATTFDEFIGDFSFFLDAYLGLDSRGLRLLGEPSRWLANSNWKTGVENISGDAYHAVSLHQSIVDIGVGLKMMDLMNDYSLFHAEDGKGGLMCWNLNKILPPGTTVHGYTNEVWAMFDKEGLDENHMKLLYDFQPMAMGLFPNVSFFKFFNVDPMTNKVATFIWMRIHQPRGPKQYEIWNYFFNQAVEPEENCALAYQSGLFMLGAAGFLDMDDQIAWEGPAMVGSTTFAKKQGMSFNYQMGMKEGIGTTIPIEWEGPGVGVKKPYHDGNIHNYHKNWLDMMSEEGERK